MSKKQHQLQPRFTHLACVRRQEDPPSAASWRLEIPAGPARAYRLAQLDDYTALSRSKLLWEAPLRMQLRARVSETDLPGTWGFGLWNDPFSFSIGLGGMSRRFPALPNAAWFFFASNHNYLSFRDDIPAQGMLAAAFSAPKLPGWLLGVGALLLPLALLPPAGRLLRRIVRRFVRQDSALLTLDPREWHSYELNWGEAGVIFAVDGIQIYRTSVAPKGPLGLVLWIDNQFASWSPGGRLRYGYLSHARPAWLEIKGLHLV